MLSWHIYMLFVCNKKLSNLDQPICRNQCFYWNYPKLLIFLSLKWWFLKTTGPNYFKFLLHMQHVCLTQDSFIAAYFFTSSKKWPFYWSLFSITHNLNLVMEKLHKNGNFSLNVQKFIAKKLYWVRYACCLGPNKIKQFWQVVFEKLHFYWKIIINLGLFQYKYWFLPNSSTNLLTCFAFKQHAYVLGQWYCCYVFLHISSDIFIFCLPYFILKFWVVSLKQWLL